MRACALAWSGFAALALAAQDRWVPLGPQPITSGPYTGRVSAIAPSRQNQDRYYVAGADGGVWRTDDGGANWIPLGDDLPVTAIGALAVDPGNDQVVFAGLGEGNFANHSRYGLGFARSSDGGQSWQVAAGDTFGGRCFSRIRVHPTDPQVLFAAVAIAGGFPSLAAARNHPGTNGPLGIFQSSDRGVTWRHLTNGIPGNVSATDVAIDPQNPSIVYAAFGHIFGHASNGIYKSTDGGASFVRLAGLPAAVGRITLALAPTQSGRLYASLVNPCNANGDNGGTLGVYRSDNGGQSWTNTNAPSYQSTYGWYLCTSVVSPSDPNLVLIGGLTCHRSTSGGGGWTTVTPPHVDLHALEYDAAGRLLCGNDGGLHRSTTNGGAWQALNQNLGLVQYYAGISIHPTQPSLIWGGTQDNGTLRRGAGLGWSSVLGGDGGCTAIDSTGTRVFAEYQGTGNLYRSLNGGSFTLSNSGITGRNCFLPPYEIHPLDPLLMVYGTERVFRSTNGGTNWSPISPDLTAGGQAAIRGLAFSPSDRNVVWAATNDGRIQVTQDAGQNWLLRRTNVPGWPRTTRPFALHPTDPRRCWLAVSSFGTDQVLYTQDQGQSWSVLDGDLPDLPANSIAIDVTSGEPPIVYVGTDQGVWRSEDHGQRWRRHGAYLPNTPVIDLRADPPRARLVAVTQGRGLWQVALAPRGTQLAWPRER
jgi:photosystem II stability/assembly factor-like uncharacterized protein